MILWPKIIQTCIFINDKHLLRIMHIVQFALLWSFDYICLEFDL